MREKCKLLLGPRHSQPSRNLHELSEPVTNYVITIPTIISIIIPVCFKVTTEKKLRMLTN